MDGYSEHSGVFESEMPFYVEAYTRELHVKDAEMGVIRKQLDLANQRIFLLTTSMKQNSTFKNAIQARESELKVNWDSTREKYKMLLAQCSESNKTLQLQKREADEYRNTLKSVWGNVLQLRQTFDTLVSFCEDELMPIITHMLTDEHAEDHLLRVEKNGMTVEVDTSSPLKRKLVENPSSEDSKLELVASRISDLESLVTSIQVNVEKLQGTALNAVTEDIESLVASIQVSAEKKQVAAMNTLREDIESLIVSTQVSTESQQRTAIKALREDNESLAASIQVNVEKQQGTAINALREEIESFVGRNALREDIGVELKRLTKSQEKQQQLFDKLASLKSQGYCGLVATSIFTCTSMFMFIVLVASHWNISNDLILLT